MAIARTGVLERCPGMQDSVRGAVMLLRPGSGRIMAGLRSDCGAKFHVKHLLPDEAG
ncbi:MAG: hypothetical protein Q4C71_05285 [Microbacteriaceae bacterium]|nr:hypothetical protein [Microbacteriaceae bacterium]